MECGFGLGVGKCLHALVMDTVATRTNECRIPQRANRCVHLDCFVGRAILNPWVRSELAWGQSLVWPTIGACLAVIMSVWLLLDVAESTMSDTLNLPGKVGSHPTVKYFLVLDGRARGVGCDWMFKSGLLENDIHICAGRPCFVGGCRSRLAEPGQQGGPAHFVLVDSLDGWDWTDWTTLPDSTIVARFDGEDELNNGLVVTEDMDVISYTDEVNFALSETEGMLLTDASLASGSLLLEVKHSLPSEVQMLYDLPGVTINDASLSIPMLLPPATATDPVQPRRFDLTGASFDFSGISGQETNALQVTILATAGEINNPEGFFIIGETDSVVVSLTFQSLNLQTLGGYFGTYTEGASGDVALLDTIPLPEPVIDLEGTTASLHFTNSVAADLLLHLDTLQFDDQLVEGDLIGGHLIPRAVWVGNEPQPSEWSLDLGSPGSTFLDLLETFPKSLHASGRMTLNPEDNSAWLLDRWDADYPPTFWYELRVPLKLGLNGIVLRDTFDIDGMDEFPQFNGHLHLDFESTFPVEVKGILDYDRMTVSCIGHTCCACKSVARNVRRRPSAFRSTKRWLFGWSSPWSFG